MSSVCKELRALNQSNYNELVKKSMIHHIVEKGQSFVGCELTSDKLNFVRIGIRCTKVGYVKIPVFQSNLDVLMKKYNNNNLRYILMVVDFGDFKNEGISEYVLYSRFISNARKREREMEDIIKIFKEPFTPETLEIACSIIERGADITRHLNENPTVSLEEGSSLRK